MRFVGCEISDLDLSGSKLEDVTFQDCKIRGVKLLNATVKNCKFIDCKEVAGALFNNATCTVLRVQNCKCRNASFAEAQLEFATFAHSTLAGASFVDSTQQSSSYIDCNLQGTQWQDMEGKALAFTECELQQADFKGAFFAGEVAYRGGNLCGPNFSDVGCEVGGRRRLASNLRMLTLEGTKIAPDTFDTAQLESLNKSSTASIHGKDGAAIASFSWKEDASTQARCKVLEEKLMRAQMLDTFQQFEGGDASKAPTRRYDARASFDLSEGVELCYDEIAGSSLAAKLPEERVEDAPPAAEGIACTTGIGLQQPGKTSLEGEAPPTLPGAEGEKLNTQVVTPTAVVDTKLYLGGWGDGHARGLSLRAGGEVVQEKTSGETSQAEERGTSHDGTGGGAGILTESGRLLLVVGCGGSLIHQLIESPLNG